MPTLAAGSLKATQAPGHRGRRHAGRRPSGPPSVRGFTLLELLVVIAIVAVASAGVALTLRDSSASRLERDAQRLAAVLEFGRAQSRMQGTVVFWRAAPGGFMLDGLNPPLVLQPWLDAGTTVEAVLRNPAAGAKGAERLSLGPEPILEAQALVLTLRDNPEVRLQVATDGLRPFGLVPVGTALGTTPGWTAP